MADFQPDMTPPGTAPMPLGQPVPAPTKRAPASKAPAVQGKKPSKPVGARRFGKR